MNNSGKKEEFHKLSRIKESGNVKNDKYTTITYIKSGGDLNCLKEEINYECNNWY